MTEMLTRSVIDNRLLRQTGQLDTTLGASAGAVFDAPTLGGLLAGFGEQALLSNPFTEEERIARREEETARWQETDRLQQELVSVSDPARRDEITSRLDALQVESEVHLDGLTRRAVEDGRLVEPDALNEEFGDIGLSFDRATSREEADYIAANKREEIVRNAIIESGPQGALPGIARFGAGLAAMAVDPVEVATAFIPVVGPAGRTAAVSRFGRVGGRAVVGVTEGAIGNAITEPIFYGLSQAQQLDYSMSDALTNVGLGALFGGVMGLGVGAISRADPRVTGDAQAPRYDAQLAQQSADIALRQFATGQTVNIRRLLDGTDLRSTTTLSRVGGIEFQAERVVDLPVGQNAADLRPTIIAQTREGVSRTFDTIQKADVFAEKIGGEVAISSDGIIVRQLIEGEIVRDPFGKPLTFKNERAASKFIAAAREVPEGAKPVRMNINGQRRFGVVHGMAAKDIRALERGADTASIPDGVNTREVAVLPDAEARLDEAVRSTFAEAKIAKEFATDAQNIELDPQVDLDASRRADVVLPETFVSDTVEEMDALVRQLDEAGELSAEAKAELAEIDEITTRTTDYNKAVRAAATCLLGRS